MEKLFKKLKELGYTEWLGISGNSVAHEIIEWYTRYGKLDGCDLVYKEHRDTLAEFYFDGSEKFFSFFDWNNLPVACSGHW